MSVALQEPPLTILPQVPGEPYRLSVEQYDQMIRAGILAGPDRVELLEGRIVTRMTKNERHIASGKLVYRALERLLPAGWHLAKDDPIVVPYSQPEPDLAVIRGAIRDYLERHPGPRDVALVVEISDSSLPNDRGTKKRIYARAGIAAYWIVNLPAGRLEVSPGPAGTPEAPEYGARADLGPDDEVEVVIDGQAVGKVAVRDLLP